MQLTFDVIQISALMALTGGLANPFALLVLAPVTVAAASLDARETVALGAELWEQHWRNHAAIVALMREAEQTADAIRTRIAGIGHIA